MNEIAGVNIGPIWPVLTSRLCIKGGERRYPEQPLRLTARHFPRNIPGNYKKKSAQRRCTVCAKYKKRKDTSYMCQICLEPLCLMPCFERFHTVEDY